MNLRNLWGARTRRQHRFGYPRLISPASGDTRRYDLRIGLFGDAPFQRNQVSYLVVGCSGGYAGDALEKSLGNAKAPTISRILTLEQRWYGERDFAGIVEQDVDSKKRSRRNCSGGCAGAVGRGEPCCGKKKRLTSVARLGVNKGRSSQHITICSCTVLKSSRSTMNIVVKFERYCYALHFHKDA